MSSNLSHRAKSLLLTELLVFVLVFSIQPVKALEPEIFFFDDFNDGVANSWTEHIGTWSVVDGEYFTTVGIANSISTVEDLVLNDCVIETKLRFRETEVGYRAGIVFRYIDNEHYYIFDLSNEYDQVEFKIFTPDHPMYGINLGNVPYSIDSNINYILRVEVVSNTFTGFLNGEKILSVTDDNYTNGRVGLFAHRAHVFFDNFKVLSIYYDWAYRQRVNIIEDSGYSLSNFPVSVTFKHDGNVQPDGDDIRVVIDKIEIPSCLEELNETHATVTFEVNLSAWETKTVYIYYGNPNAEAPNYDKVPLAISEGNTGYAIIDNSVYIGWEYTKWGWNGDNNPVVLLASYKIDFDGNGDPTNDADLISDVSGRKGGIGRHRKDFGGGVVRSFGLGDYQSYVQTPIYIDVKFTDATLRIYRNHHWIETAQADFLFMFSPSWDYANYGTGSEQNIIDGKDISVVTAYPWNDMYNSPMSPEWMAFRNSVSGLIFASTGVRIGSEYNYSFAAKEGSDWDRKICYFGIEPYFPLDPYDQPSECRIYWYGDYTNGFSNIERMAQIFNNKPSYKFPVPTLNTTNSQIPPEPSQVYEFDLLDTVYVFGEGYEVGETYPIYVVEDKVWKNGDTIPQRIAGTLQYVQTNSEGKLLVMVGGEWRLQTVWNPPLMPGKYDIIIDINGNGVYDAGIDVLCDNNVQVTAGFFVVPEAPLGTITILMITLISLAVYKKDRTYQKSPK